MAMTEAERSKCKTIIHGHAAAVAAGNAATFIPGLGFAVNTAALTTMTMALANVFNVSITKTLAGSLAAEALKKYATKKIASEFIKVIPGFGTAVSAALNVGIVESAGWSLANEFASQKA